MQTQNWRLANAAIAIALVTVFAVSFTTLALAGNSDEVQAIFASAPKDATRVKGVEVFADRPKGFNPLTANNHELAMYGLPQRPDKATDPKGYAIWERGMMALKYRPSDVKAMPYSSTELRPAKGKGPTPTSVGSYNWSGFANTNTLKKWSKKASYDEVTSVWNVPNAQPPFGACANNITGPFYEVSWNGIDGFGSGDVVQGGSYSAADCYGDRSYIGWVEWYPSYSILELYCGSNPCPVSPGDDFWVVTYGVAGTATQSVYVEDITNQWGGTLSLSWVSGPGVIGNSEEWIVERPCCDGSGYPLPLANTIYDFFDYSFGYSGNGVQHFAGSQAASTYDIFMVDDGDTQTIEDATSGTAGYQGKYSIWFNTVGCALSGGCTPD